MARKAPGKAHRKGLTLLDVAAKFSDEDNAREWIEELRWPEGPFCPKCGSFNVQSNIKHKTMTHRCRDCPGRPMFTLRMGTVMEGTKMKYRVWAIGMYLYMTNIKGVSSMRLHRELGIGQKAAWFMLHRLREAHKSGATAFVGPIEADETAVGGKRGNMSNSKRKELEHLGRGSAGKTIVAGAKDRETNKVAAKVVESTNAETLQGFVSEHSAPDATVYTDEAIAYKGLPNHESVKHSARQYVKRLEGQDIHTNGIESFWSILKRGQVGIYHKMSPKHLDRYVTEFVGRHNVRESDTMEQMGKLVLGMERKRLRYTDLVADNGMDSGARA